MPPGEDTIESTTQVQSTSGQPEAVQEMCHSSSGKETPMAANNPFAWLVLQWSYFSIMPVDFFVLISICNFLDVLFQKKKKGKNM